MDERTKEAIREAAALVRGDGLSVLTDLCHRHQTISTHRVMTSIDITRAFMTRCGALIRSLSDERHRAIAEVEQLTSERDELKVEVERWKGEHGQACLLVVKMHFAATGSTDGPKRGVVEGAEDLRSDLTRAREEGRESMREDAAKVAATHSTLCFGSMYSEQIAKKIRAIPIKEGE